MQIYGHDVFIIRLCSFACHDTILYYNTNHISLQIFTGMSCMILPMILPNEDGSVVAELGPVLTSTIVLVGLNKSFLPFHAIATVKKENIISKLSVQNCPECTDP
jgi:hypothetical protein